MSLTPVGLMIGVLNKWLRESVEPAEDCADVILLVLRQNGYAVTCQRCGQDWTAYCACASDQEFTPCPTAGCRGILDYDGSCTAECGPSPNENSAAVDNPPSSRSALTTSTPSPLSERTK